MWSQCAEFPEISEIIYDLSYISKISEASLSTQALFGAGMGLPELSFANDFAAPLELRAKGHKGVP